MIFHVHVRITPRAGLLDPQGQAVVQALTALGFAETHSVRIGRAIELEVEAADAAGAARRTEEMCATLLANPVTEDYSVTVDA